MEILLAVGIVVVLIGALYRYTYVLEWFVAPNSETRNSISSKGFWWDDHYCFSCDNFVKDCTCSDDCYDDYYDSDDDEEDDEY